MASLAICGSKEIHCLLVHCHSSSVSLISSLRIPADHPQAWCPLKAICSLMVIQTRRIDLERIILILGVVPVHRCLLLGKLLFPKEEVPVSSGAYYLRSRNSKVGET